MFKQTTKNYGLLIVGLYYISCAMYTTLQDWSLLIFLAGIEQYVFV